MRGAAAGGFGTLVCMPNTTPPLDNHASVRFVVDKAQRCGPVKVWPAAAISQGREGKRLSEFGDLIAAGAVGVTDDGDPVTDSSLMRRALEYSTQFDIPVMSDSEDRSLSRNGVMNEGVVSTRLGLKGIPAAAEEIGIARDIRLAELTGGRLHLQHVSTAGGAELIRRARDKGRRQNRKNQRGGSNSQGGFSR
ncbi:MAG: dihydroorotase, partial [bacterium]|nr:dihydroorotase [bacterium]